jgi:aspartate kinase
MKFGGTSVGSGERILHVARIVLAHQDQQPVVVTSALSGATDALLALAQAAAAGDDAACASQLEALVSRHHEAALAINPEADWSALHQKLELLGAAVQDALEQGEPSSVACDSLVAWGERLAVVLVAGALHILVCPTLAWDRPIVATDEHALPLAGSTRRLAEEALALAGKRLLVVPGFIAHKPDGRMTTLGRGGSDYSATLLAAALQAEACWIYTDVDGILSADPRVVKEAQILPTVSPQMAGRLSYSGAKVLHPLSVAPVARLGIPLRVRNTFRPDHPGTLITAQPGKHPGTAQAITSRRDLAAILLAGEGLPEVAHLFGRMCQVMTRAGIEMVLSVHPGTGYDPQILVKAAQAAAAVEQLTQEFASECGHGQIQSITVREGQAVCTVIGEELGGAVLAQVQHTLAAEGIAPLVQMAFPSALSLVLPDHELEHAIRSIHRQVIEPSLRKQGAAPAYSHKATLAALNDDEEPERRVAASCL